MVGKACNRVQRGMVFWFDPLQRYGGTGEFTLPFNPNRLMKSHLQLNERPWLVVSTDLGNNTSDTCNIVPITEENKPDLPCHVKYIYQGKQQTVLVEQIKTVDALALGGYMYTLSDECMIQVEKAMVSQYGIRPSVTYVDLKLSNLVTHLENLVNSIIKEKSEMLEVETSGMVSDQQIEDAATRLSTALESLSPKVPKPQKKDSSQPAKDNSKVFPTTPTKDKYAGMSTVEKFNAKYGLNKTPSPTDTQATHTSPPKTSKPKRNTWTVESRKQYLKDCEQLSPQEVMKKYNFSTINSVFQTKYACKNALDSPKAK